MNRQSIVLLISLASIAVTSTPAQEVVVPTQMTFRAASETSSSSTATSIMRTTTYHTQLLYDNSHFTGQGVNGPIVIDRLRFRAEDGEISAGGQFWANVTVQLSDAPVGMTPATMSSTFAANLGSNLGTAETLAVTAGVAAGSVPNSYHIDIPLTSGAFTYDPTTMGALVISFRSTSAPTPNSNIAPLASSNSVANHLARSLSATNTGAATGSLSASVPVCRIGFSGAGGRTVQAGLTRSLGCSCTASGATFYEWFPLGRGFDLANRSIAMLPETTTAPNGYTVSLAAAAPDLTRIGLRASTADNALITMNLPFTFHFPGGSTADIKVSTNGYVWLSGTPTINDITPTVLELLGNNSSNFPARLAPFWFDLHAGRNTTTHPLSGLYTNIDTSGGSGNVVVYLTWREIGVVNSRTTGGQSVNTFQVVMRESDMSVEYRYGAIDAGQGGNMLVGFSRGGRGSSSNAVDPASRDLSGMPTFSIGGPESGSAMVLTGTNPVVPGVNRPIHGTSINLAVSNVPTSDNFGFFMVDFAALPTSLPNPFLAPGCLQTLAAPQLWAIAFGWPSGGTANCPIPFAVPQGFVGVNVVFQFASWNLATSPVNVHTSNALAFVIGQQ